MGKILSAAGEIAFEMKSVETDPSGFIIVGRMGVWDAKVYLSYKEMFGSFLKPRAVLATLKIPFLLLVGLFRRNGK